jgi:hypothetical protein
MSKIYSQWEENSEEVSWKNEDDSGKITTGSISRNSAEVQSFLGNGGEIVQLEVFEPIE